MAVMPRDCRYSMMGAEARPAYVPRRFSGTSGWRMVRPFVRLVDDGLAPRDPWRSIGAPREHGVDDFGYKVGDPLADLACDDAGMKGALSRSSQPRSARGSPTLYPNSSSLQVISPSIARAYGSRSSLAGLNRWP